MKTRKNRSQKRERCCPATYRQINKWYEAMFEKLGWMVLAKAKGYNDKVNSYKHSLHRLRQAIELKLEQIFEMDKIQDLQILHTNLMILIEHVNRDFK